MKIDYDVNLYRKIASLSLNELIQVRNRKDIKFTIHVQNITRLSWRELQILVPDGVDRFTKMVLLYEQFVNSTGSAQPPLKGESLTPAEMKEINDYIKIYRENSFSKHFEINKYISDNNLWGRFPTIRSLNDHGKYKEIQGIQPKYFEVFCQLLNISGEDGLPLDSYKRY